MYPWSNPTPKAYQVAKWKSACQLQEVQETWVSPRVRKIPWSSKWQPTSEFLLGKFHGERSLVDYSPWGSQTMIPMYYLLTGLNAHMTENTYTHIYIYPYIYIWIYPEFLMFYVYIQDIYVCIHKTSGIQYTEAIYLISQLMPSPGDAKGVPSGARTAEQLRHILWAIGVRLCCLHRPP